MTLRKTVKTARKRAALVVVIASPDDLRRAVAMADPPDFFELRLDHLFADLARIKRKSPTLRAPLIITARHPSEGGVNNLSIRQRQEALLRFLPHAKYVDVELRSVRALRPVLLAAKKQRVKRIISVHDFQRTPSSRSLRAKLGQAKAAGADIFKIACRTDNISHVARLINFLNEHQRALRISAMGIGQLGALSRILLARSGSALNYATLGPPQLEGQLPIEILRSALRVKR